MVHNMTMKKVNIFEAKAHLSECVDAVQRGERVVICRRNRPVAELRAVGSARTAPRPFGGAKGLTIRAAFYKELPGEWVDAFYGQPASGDSAPRSASRVAKRSTTSYSGRPRPARRERTR
jgi:antitoxin (DNA-binding transcriptional repressor) of toxin-antitoxin stability system